MLRIIVALVAHGALEGVGGRCDLHLESKYYDKNDKLAKSIATGQCYNKIARKNIHITQIKRNATLMSKITNELSSNSNQRESIGMSRSVRGKVTD